MPWDGPQAVLKTVVPGKDRGSTPPPSSRIARVVELADTADSSPAASRLVGSTPTLGTTPLYRSGVLTPITVTDENGGSNPSRGTGDWQSG